MNNHFSVLRLSFILGLAILPVSRLQAFAISLDEGDSGRAAVYVEIGSNADFSEQTLASMEPMAEQLCAEQGTRVLLRFEDSEQACTMAEVLSRRLRSCGVPSDHIQQIPIIAACSSERPGLIQVAMQATGTSMQGE